MTELKKWIRPSACWCWLDFGHDTKREMMTMKTRRNFLKTILAASAAGAVPGWALFLGTDGIAIAAVIARTAAEVGTVAAIRADPSRRFQFEIALELLEKLTQDENYSATKLAEVLQATGVSLFRGDQGALVVGAVVSVFEIATSTAYIVESGTAVRALAEAIKLGIRSGLAATRSRWKPSIAPTYEINPVHRVKL